MPLRFSLDFTVPFEVGDIVYTDYPSCEQSVVGVVTRKPGLKATVSSIKLVFETGLSGGVTVTELTSQQEIPVDRIIYTLIPDGNLFSAFTVECQSTDDRGPQLFATQEQLLTYQQQQV